MNGCGGIKMVPRGGINSIRARGPRSAPTRGFSEELVTYISIFFNNLWVVRCRTLHHEA